MSVVGGGRVPWTTGVDVDEVREVLLLVVADEDLELVAVELPFEFLAPLPPFLDWRGCLSGDAGGVSLESDRSRSAMASLGLLVGATWFVFFFLGAAFLGRGLSGRRISMSVSMGSSVMVG